jgi:bifunctional UDP-N-acetylglucosamine pyrophosphorylase / glucosamine-1-phosphate N-acetyltransferase
MSELTVIVLAAGHGKRMKSRLPKPLHELGGRTMLGHVLAAVEELRPERVVVVVGHGREQVGAHAAEVYPEVVVAVQEEQLGTGHAARIGLGAVPPAGGDVLVLTADTPLLEPVTLSWLRERHHDDDRAVSILTAHVDDPTGYGRIVRSPEGDVWAIVEEKDASAAEVGVTEINSGILLFDADFLREALPQLGQENAAHEFYLTDSVRLARQDGLGIGGYLVEDHWQTEGANDGAQLTRLGKELNRRVVERWMRNGVTVFDPDTTWIHVQVELGRDVVLQPGTQLLGGTTLADGVQVGPDCTLTDCTVGVGARIVRTQAWLATVGEDAHVGPYASLEPGSTVPAGRRTGPFLGLGPGMVAPEGMGDEHQASHSGGGGVGENRPGARES